MDETGVKRKATEKKTEAGSTGNLRDFEMVLVIKPELDEGRFNATIENVKKIITGFGGTVTDVQPWGKRRLAYPIKGAGEGTYVLTHFKLEPSRERELEARLRITDDIARHLVIRPG